MMNKSIEKQYIIRNKLIPSRFFFAPINTGYSDNGYPNGKFAEFYNERSGKNIGITYIGNVAIGPPFVSNNKTLYFTSNVQPWRKITETIRKNGTVPGIQIACRTSKITPMKIMVSDDISNYINQVTDEILSLSESDISLIVDLFIQTALKAYSLGFEVIQIHAAHGYFLSQLLEPKLNLRNDEYGLNKLLILEQIINGIRKALPDVILDIRISTITGLNSAEEDISYKHFVIENLSKLDIDIISLSNGFYNINKEYIYPPLSWGHAIYLNQALKFAKLHPKKIFNIAGNIWDLTAEAFQDIPENLTLSIGRALIADPNFILNKDEKALCNRCDECHYYSKSMSELSCPLWSNLEPQIKYSI